MPIVDVEVVVLAGVPKDGFRADALADRLGETFGSPPGATWVRLHFLDSTAYAENGCKLDIESLPVFVTVVRLQLPKDDALIAEIGAVTRAVADCLGRPRERVHVQFAPAAAGRLAFGGLLAGATTGTGGETP